MNTIADQNQREAALNPAKSFIVQAPAGSGKTELLTQRYLVLLAQVKQPEEILAITFTKKSAAEMRARIINALKNAAESPQPQSAHAKTTWNLAQSALKRNQLLKWNLLDNPNRLRIQTIDSFNAYVTKQLPILSHFGAPPEITEDSTVLYRTAIKEFLMYLEDNSEWSNAIALLLIHLDNDLTKVENLLINLLSKRDQWLPYITLNANDPKLRQKLEQHLANVSIDALTHLKKVFPKEYSDELIDLANFAATNLINENSKTGINECANLIHLPGTAISDKPIWLGLGELLLTKEGQWRKQFTKTIGFPAASSTKNPFEKNLFESNKQRMSELLSKLQSYPEILYAISDLRLTPDWAYQESQWQLLDALHQVLRIAVAQLKLIFQQQGKIDYIESAQGALIALGTEDCPTDLALTIDYRLQHILIDEFQDTSNSQYRLIEKLTAGWSPDDGRTLFVVGDPMQSIYRFREAEVGYFIRARLRGLNQLTLEPLTLSVNFRSVPAIVNWVNEHFPKIFPTHEDIATGAVTYSPSIASVDQSDASAVTLHTYINAEETAAANTIVSLIQQLKTEHPKESIAILVRSRTHLSAIIPALKKAALAFKAIDIDPLITRPVIQDLMALTRALLHPADRIAWLSILRAPWCGLELNDLMLIAGENASLTIWEQLQKPAILQSLSHEGQQRLARITPILFTKLADRHRFSLRAWLESTWILFGGPACITQANEIDDASAYFKLLDKFDRSGEIPNLDELEQQVSRLFASPNNQADDSLQIMTVHNAKGLEFDTVILPHLERKSPSDDKQLMLWMERPRAGQQNALLLAPIHAVGNDNDSIYEYIKRQHAIKTDYESARLLYVATTRAKKRLHLFFSLQQENGKMSEPASSSLLNKLWNSIAPEILNKTTSDYHNIHLSEHHASTDVPAVKSVRKINRLSLNWVNPIKEWQSTETITYHNKNSGFLLRDHNPRITGIFLHQLLQQICLNGADWWQKQSTQHIMNYCKRQLLQLGMLPHDVPLAIERVKQAISNTLNDPRGRWIIQPHAHAQSEMPLTMMVENQIKSIVIDRTFIDETGIRWIIDYKTSEMDTDGDIQSFLQSEKAKYQQQLTQYAKALRGLNQQTIHLGLYYPLLSAWDSWVFSEENVVYSNSF